MKRPFFHLINKKDFDLFRQIMDTEAVDPNIRDQQGNTLLIHSVDDDAKIIFTKYLLQKGANVNAVDNRGMDALFKATYWGEKETVKLLVKRKDVDINRENRAFDFILSPLVAAIFKNHYEVAKILLYNGADPEKAEKIISMEYRILRDSFQEKYQRILDFYKRWNKGKKQVLLSYEFSKQRQCFEQSSEKEDLFDVGLLPKCIVDMIARDYL